MIYLYNISTKYIFYLYQISTIYILYLLPILFNSYINNFVMLAFIIFPSLVHKINVANITVYLSNKGARLIYFVCLLLLMLNEMGWLI